MRTLASIACLVLATPSWAQQGPPDYFVEGAALLRVASHMAAQCEDVQVDIEADIELRGGVYDLLDRHGWAIDDPRLHSETAREAVLKAAEKRYDALGLDTPLVREQVCPVARAEADAQSVLGRLFKVETP